MPLIWIIMGSLGHAVAAVLFASYAILISRRAHGQLKPHLIVVALAITALWSLRHALLGAMTGVTAADGVIETARNGAWLAVVWAHLRTMPAGRASRIGRPLVAGALLLLLVVQLCFDMLIGGDATGETAPALLPLVHASWLLRCIFTLGGLVLLHGLSSRREHPGAAAHELWLSAGLAFLWAYDFNHYMLAWATDNAAVVTGPVRGVVVALLAVPLLVGARTASERRLALSRPVAMRLVSAGIIAVYLLSVALLVTIARDMSAPLGRLVQLSLLFALAVGVLALLPSAALRSWLRVEITKHFFAHRYDYRAVWLGFAATVGRTGQAHGPLGARLTRAIAEVMQAPGALLFLRAPEGRLVRADAWQWPADAPVPALPAALVERLEPTGWILDIAADWPSHGALLPAWMEQDRRAWVLAPLIHERRLEGAILLSAPSVPATPRRIDWEDLDVLRVVCGEAAALISEARSREALAEAQRFEEFNRRFAFILHDLKNLVSQMSLLASNAERHADNPAFRADMVLTLKETVSRMTVLLDRLGRPDSVRCGDTRDVPLGALLRTLQPRWASGLGPVELHGDVVGAVRADPEGLERALGHLVKNGIEASPPGAPVQVELAIQGNDALIHVRDSGCGMDAAFIREALFRPFSSTKSNGFGLGVHEARLLVAGMGGALYVESEPGAGTVFTVRLPLVAADAPVSPDLSRRTA